MFSLFRRPRREETSTATEETQRRGAAVVKFVTEHFAKLGVSCSCSMIPAGGLSSCAVLVCIVSSPQENGAASALAQRLIEKRLQAEFHRRIQVFVRFEDLRELPKNQERSKADIEVEELDFAYYERHVIR